MDKNWKVLKVKKDGEKPEREILATLIEVSSISEAVKKAKIAVDIIVKHGQESESSMSISSENINLILHGFSKKPINNKDWALAEEIEKAIR